MRFEIVEIPELSGEACKIYSIAYNGSEDTLFDYFLDKIGNDFPEEVESLWDKLEYMGREGGARIQFFREDEGRPGDGIVALLKETGYPLRLYCIRYGSCTLILGNGGFKPPSVRAWQEDPFLEACVKGLMSLSSQITERIKNREITFDSNGSLVGDLVFEIETEE